MNKDYYIDEEQTGFNKKTSVIIAAASAVALLMATIILAFVLKEKKEDQEASVPVIVETTMQSEASSFPDTTVIATVDDARNEISEYAAVHGKTLADYPNELINLLIVSPDALDFVLDYPLSAGQEVQAVDISGEVNRLEVPHLYQWDSRWGFKTYGAGVMGMTGSGPTCLSMTAVYLLKNYDMTPSWIADYGINNGYTDDTTDNGGWCSLMTDGAYNLGIDVVQITVEDQRIKRNLDVGNICLVQLNSGTGASEGHYILITDYEEDGFVVIDPYIETNNDRLWTIEELEASVQRIWVYRIL